MTSPWPEPDLTLGIVMCCLCFSMKSLIELSKNDEGELTDVCLECRLVEIETLIAHKDQILRTIESEWETS